MLKSKFLIRIQLKSLGVLFVTLTKISVNGSPY